MARRRDALCAVLIAAFVLATGTARCGHGQTTDEEIGRWIGELRHASYHRRRRATRQLAAAGRPAIAPLATAADGDDLEAASRATHVLLQLSQSPATAEAALASLAKLTSRSATQRAAARTQIARIRRERRIAGLRQLGAQITVVRGDWAATSGVHVRIDGAWKGGPADLAELIHLEQLTVLHFDGVPLGDDALRRLAPLRSVEELKLWYVPVTDQGLLHLQHWKRLRSVQLYGTGVTADGAAALAKALPAADVDRRAGALLGIGPLDEVGPCRIGVIRAGSSAATSGLQRFDVLIEFDGKKIANFDDLRTLIATKRPGEQVQIAYTRDGRRHETTVTLGRWK